jgi:hypothetical protein
MVGRGGCRRPGRGDGIMRKVRWGFKSKKQLSLFMIWEELWEDGEVFHANVLFNSRDWIGL